MEHHVAVAVDRCSCCRKDWSMHFIFRFGGRRYIAIEVPPTKTAEFAGCRKVPLPALVEVGKLLSKCLTLNANGDVDGMIEEAFQDAIDECEYSY